MSNDNLAIDVRGVSKTFRLPHERHSGLKQKILSVGRTEKGYEVQKVLDDVSFQIKKGEFFGIVGRNGSGKSTLLKTIAGIYAPDEGRVAIDGKLVPFIELGVGFNPELTGRENVFLNGALLGFSRKEIQSIYDEIVDFAELERFMDQKLKNYSSGMQVRLAFSIAIRAKGDILLLDEVLAVGDARFQEKCYDYFHKVKASGKTVIFISHDMNAVEKFCDRAAYIKNGSIVKIGSPSDISSIYFVENFGDAKSGKDDENTTVVIGQNIKDIKAKIVDKKEKYYQKDKIVVECSFTAVEEGDFTLKLAVLKDGMAVAHINSKEQLSPHFTKGKQSCRLVLDLSNFLVGNHEINWGVFDYESDKKLAMQLRADNFLVINDDQTRSGFFKLDGKWQKQ